MNVTPVNLKRFPVLMSSLGKHSSSYLHGIMKVNAQGERTDAFTQGDINHHCVFSMENSLS